MSNRILIAVHPRYEQETLSRFLQERAPELRVSCLNASSADPQDPLYLPNVLISLRENEATVLVHNWCLSPEVLDGIYSHIFAEIPFIRILALVDEQPITATWLAPASQDHRPSMEGFLNALRGSGSHRSSTRWIEYDSRDR